MSNPHDPHPRGYLSYGAIEFTVPQTPCIDCKAQYPRTTRTQERCATCQAAHKRVYMKSYQPKWQKGWRKKKGRAS